MSHPKETLCLRGTHVYISVTLRVSSQPLWLVAEGGWITTQKVQVLACVHSQDH